jgi:uncharacterized protein DUF1996
MGAPMKHRIPRILVALTLLSSAIYVALPATPALAVQPGAILSSVQATPNGADANQAANVDPIVSPGPVGTQSAHPHVFCGADGLSSASTPASMVAGPTTFFEQGAHSGIWMPEVKYDGVPLDLNSVPNGGEGKDCLVYYREVNNVTGTNIPGQFTTSGNGIPFGLKMVLKEGTFNGKVVNFGDELVFKCGPGSTGDLAAPPSQCSAGIISFSARFPHCWDGVNLDTVEPDGDPAVNPVTQVAYPNDHISHMQYGPCDADHPIETIRVEQFFRFQYGTGVHDISLLTLGGNHWNTFHTDYVFAWEDETMQDFMEKCILVNLACSTNVVDEGGLANGGGGGGTGPTGGTGGTGGTGTTGPGPDPKPIVTAVGTVVGSDAGGLTVVPGATHTVDDFEVLACETANQTVSLTTANGFTPLGSSVGVNTAGGSTATRITLFSRVWDGSAGSPVVTQSGTNHVICNITSFDKGTVAATATSSEATADMSGSATLPSGTDGLFVLFAANALPNSNQVNQITQGGPETELVDQANTAGNGGLLYIATDAAVRTSPFTYTTFYATAKAHLLLRLT